MSTLVLWCKLLRGVPHNRRIWGEWGMSKQGTVAISTTVYYCLEMSGHVRSSKPAFALATLFQGQKKITERF